MSTFDGVIAAQLSGRTVRYADLVRLAFKSGEIRLFQGQGLLVDGNGEEWKGIGRLGRMDAIEAGVNGAARELVLTLFGDATMLGKIRDDANETIGQAATRYIQFFDVRQYNEAGLWVEWQPLGTPYPLFRGLMGAPQLDRPVVLDMSAEMASRTITVRAVDRFSNRNRPPFGFNSHRDQQARTGGQDKIFINTSRMADAEVTWPTGLT